MPREYRKLAIIPISALIFQIRKRRLQINSATLDWKINKSKSEEIFVMNVSTSEAVKDKLFNENQIFRDLVQKHKSYEKRLAELSELSYPNDEEMLEESLLKKKKLLLKDEIFEMIQKHSTDH